MITEVSSGRRSDSLAKKILSALIEELKSPEIFGLISRKKNAQVIISSDELGLSSGAFEYVQLDFSFDPRLEMQEISTYAMFVKSEFAPRIEVEITYPDRPFRLVDIADIYPELLENIRHELEHSGQTLDSGVESSPENLQSLDDFVGYYTDPQEIEAFVSGLMAKAKSRGTPLSQVIDDKVDAILNDAEDVGISDAELQGLDSQLRHYYFKYAHRRYPNMK